MYTCSQDRMKEKIQAFSQFGDTGNGGVTRYSLSPEAHRARDYFVERLQRIGAIIEMDDMANLYATIPGAEASMRKLVMGSHCDSVKNGGNYDGILGVIGAMEVLETVVAEKIPHRHPLTAMIWTNEEGSLYPPAMMSSGVVCNEHLPKDIREKFEKEKMLSVPSLLDKSSTFGDALEKSPYRGAAKNRLSPKAYEAMFELHIEQGPILEDAEMEIGVVSCVLGMFNCKVSFFGQSDHAGTTPMHKRQDGLHAAAKALCYLHEEIDKLNKPELVYTTGQIFCHPNIHTVIPDLVQFSIDVRHEEDKLRSQVLEIVKSLEKRQWEKCRCEVEVAWRRDTVYFNKKLVELVKESAEELGIKNQRIHSGAGHDAQFVSYMLPTTMIFVPSKDGHSHCELEYTSLKQCTAGASVMLNAVLKADKKG